MTLRIQTLTLLGTTLLSISAAVACPPGGAREQREATAVASQRLHIVFVPHDCVEATPAPVRPERASPAADDDVVPEPAARGPQDKRVAPAARAEPPTVSEEDILTLRTRKIDSEHARVWLAVAGATLECTVHERKVGSLRFEIPRMVTSQHGPATIVVTDEGGRVLRRLAVMLDVDVEELEIERVVANP